jgi:hypothetical protein
MSGSFSGGNFGVVSRGRRFNTPETLERNLAPTRICCDAPGTLSLSGFEMTFADHRTETYGPFRPIVSLLTVLSVIALPLNGLEPACAQAANVIVAGTTSNPLLGNYRGTLTAISGLCISAQDIVASVDQNGKMTILIPGLGTGTVTPNGESPLRELWASAVGLFCRRHRVVGNRTSMSAEDCVMGPEVQPFSVLHHG